ncbi:MAG: hypothetical protein ACYTGQ_00505 [Planctomycetota bacterium]
MGTGFTIDSPLRVARFGINSVVSLVDDHLAEQMRRFHSEKAGLPYAPIARKEPEARARRITAYLDLLDKIVAEQSDKLRAEAFEPGAEITRYFDLLPDSSPLKRDYRVMLATRDEARRRELQTRLRDRIETGRIDVNIMTKADRVPWHRGEMLPLKQGEAMAALRGYAASTVDSAICFSAGMHPRLYSYVATFDSFFPDDSQYVRKKIILKVSDYRSALIQGRFLAKKGLWVWEYRIESGLNCGGHAFASDGHLMGPILQEFADRRHELHDEVFGAYQKAIAKRGQKVESLPPARVTAQGGIGTHEENRMLMERYGVDGTGWGTPFLLVPDAVNVDAEHLRKLSEATEDDVYLSGASPLGVPFWNLRTSASEVQRRKRIEEGKPGSPCPNQSVAFNTEFTKTPICVASGAYQKKKIAQLKETHTGQMLQKLVDKVVAKSCICYDLSGAAAQRHGLDSTVSPSPAVCPGPNIVNFSRVASLDEMIGHIYGRLNLMAKPERPHMFIKELRLYVDYLRQKISDLADARELADANGETEPKTETGQSLDDILEGLQQFKANLTEGIGYYRRQAERLIEEQRERFLDDLSSLQETLQNLTLGAPMEAGQT